MRIVLKFHLFSRIIKFKCCIFGINLLKWSFIFLYEPSFKKFPIIPKANIYFMFVSETQRLVGISGGITEYFKDEYALMKVLSGLLFSYFFRNFVSDTQTKTELGLR